MHKLASQFPKAVCVAHTSLLVHVAPALAVAWQPGKAGNASAVQVGLRRLSVDCVRRAQWSVFRNCLAIHNQAALTACAFVLADNRVPLPVNESADYARILVHQIHRVAEASAACTRMVFEHNDIGEHDSPVWARQTNRHVPADAGTSKETAI